jgi:hypothetical protein
MLPPEGGTTNFFFLKSINHHTLAGAHDHLSHQRSDGIGLLMADFLSLLDLQSEESS